MAQIRIASKISHLSYAIRDIVAAAEKVQKKGKKIYWLNIGDPNRFDFRPPQHVLDAIGGALKGGKYTGYAPSQGEPLLREEIAKKEGVGVESTFVTNGLSEGIDFIFAALLEAGDNILMPRPAYPLYVTKSKVLGCVENYYECGPEWVPDVGDMRRKVNGKTRAIVVINPNNPTGALYPQKVLQEIGNLAAEHDIPVIADEIYDRLVFEGKCANMRDVVGKDVKLISGNGMSKNYFYPRARVGYLALHGQGMEPLEEALVKLTNARLSVNWEMQFGLLAAMQGSMDYLGQGVEKLKKRGALLHKMLNEAPGISCTKPQAAFYAFPKVELGGRWKDDFAFVHGLLEETGVLCVPGSAFGAKKEEGYVRLVFLPQEEELQEALMLMQKYVSNGGKLWYPELTSSR